MNKVQIDCLIDFVRKLFEDWKSIFRDWRSIPKGEWSKHSTIQDIDGKTIEIGLYREPDENTEYAGTLTLQVFCNDDVVFCEQVR